VRTGLGPHPGLMQSSITIRLELRYEDGCLTGHADNGDGRREFTGWIGLLAAIDELSGGGDDTSTSTPQEEQ
jgi:hypothetical protein